MVHGLGGMNVRVVMPKAYTVQRSYALTVQRVICPEKPCCTLTVDDIVAIKRLMSMILIKTNANIVTITADAECMSSRKNSPKDMKMVREIQYVSFWQESQGSLSCSVKLGYQLSFSHAFCARFLSTPTKSVEKANVRKIQMIDSLMRSLNILKKMET